MDSWDSSSPPGGLQGKAPTTAACSPDGRASKPRACSFCPSCSAPSPVPGKEGRPAQGGPLLPAREGVACRRGQGPARPHPAPAQVPPLVTQAGGSHTDTNCRVSSHPIPGKLPTPWAPSSPGSPCWAGLCALQTPGPARHVVRPPAAWTGRGAVLTAVQEDGGLWSVCSPGQGPGWVLSGCSEMAGEVCPQGISSLGSSGAPHQARRARTPRGGPVLALTEALCGDALLGTSGREGPGVST